MKDKSIECPTCGDITMADDGLSSLPRDLKLAAKEDNILHKLTYSMCDSCGDELAMAYCNNCSDHFLCKCCLKAHQKLRSSRGHTSFTFEEAQKMPQSKLIKLISPASFNCLSHEGRPLDYYCISCSVLICRKCLLHKDHQIVKADKRIAEEKRKVISQNAEVLEKKQEELSDAIKNGEGVKEMIKSQRKEIDTSIRQWINNLHQLLKQSERTLLAQSKELSDVKELCVTEQLKEMEHLLEKVVHCQDLSSTVSLHYSDIELLSAANTLVNRSTQLENQLSQLTLELCQSPAVSVDINKHQIATRIASLSVLFDGAYPSCTTVDVVLSQVTIGKETVVKVTSRDNTGKEMSVGGAKMKGFLTSLERKGNMIPVAIRDNENGTYLLSLMPVVLGRHHLSVILHHQHIKGSPYPFYVTRDYTAMHKPTQIINDINSPQFIAISDDCGDVYVTSGDDHCIYVYDNNGKYKRSIGSHGKGHLQFQYPTGIAVVGNVLYVAENEGNRIQMVTLGGEFVGVYGSEGSGKSQLWNPWGLCLGSNGEVHVAEFGNNRVQVFDGISNTFTRILNGNIPCEHEGKFQCPRDVGFDRRSGQLHVTSYGSQGILIFNESGIYISHYGNLKDPVGIAFDAAGNYLVTDKRMNCLAVFDRTLAQLHVIAGGLRNPLGLAVDGNGSVWVADNGNNRLVKY
jgi:DNA-binding beta-propeller fold protein YncE